MGSNGARFAVLGAAVVVIVALFVVLSGGDDDESSPETTTAQKVEQEPAGGDEAKADKPKPEPKPEVPVIEVKGGQPVGGVQDLEFTAGGDIRFDVKSDTAAEVHFHGYDVMEDVEAGGEVSFDVPADIEGVFEVELEETATQIAEVTVSPA